MTKLFIITGSVGSGKSETAKLLSQKSPDLVYYLKLDDLKYNFSSY